ncbi:hypothetical protein [Arcticibacter svalbardensis]|nr:hypothetical protein [Arcticibacter svalbardensis]
MEKLSATQSTRLRNIALFLLMIVLIVLVAHEGYDFGQWLKK